MSKAIEDVLSERKRQITEEKFTDEMDDLYTDGELPSAAICYASVGLNQSNWNWIFRQYWPWDSAWFKHVNCRRSIVKASALLIAEIERIDRYEQKKIDEIDNNCVD